MIREFLADHWSALLAILFGVATIALMCIGIVRMGPENIEVGRIAATKITNATLGDIFWVAALLLLIQACLRPSATKA